MAFCGTEEFYCRWIKFSKPEVKLAQSSTVALIITPLIKTHILIAYQNSHFDNALALDLLETNTRCKIEIVLVEKEWQSIKAMCVHAGALYFMLHEKHLVWDLVYS